MGGDSYLIQASENTGMEMIYTIPYNLLLLGIMLAFIAKNKLTGYYGLNGVRCKASKLLYYIPLVMIATVNIWFGVRFKMGLLASVIYFLAMIFTGLVEEMLFRGLLFRAMSKNNLRSAIIVTSLTFGLGHIVNLVNGNSENYVETICQMCYAVAIGFLLAAVLHMGESILPCMITHAMVNALSTFSNEAVTNQVVIPVSVALCVISAVSAILIFKNAKRKY